jgi:type II secretory pathway predicted ATPase ExeA
MYESYFRLSHRPFVAAPHAGAYIPSGSLEQARQTLVRCIERAEGPGLIVGPAGIGKSLLCQVLADHFQGRFLVATLACARLGTRRALLQNVLFELKLPYRGMDESELRLSLIDRLEPRDDPGEGLLLLVDEGHTLPLRLLEEIRLLTNVVRDGRTRVRLVLAGGMALEERLAHPKLESFHQRIAARCYLQPLRRDETVFYLHEQIRRAGGDADRLFTADAQAAVHTASDGIPRLINQVCDHALTLAALGGQRQLDAAGINEAWADLQQLPVPLHEPAALAAASGGKAGGIVEFGQLDEPAQSPALQPALPNVGDAAAAQLDAIDRGLSALASGAPQADEIAAFSADDFSPVAATGTEVELIFHSAHDPFGGQWEQEEVVIDRYALLEDAALRSRKAPRSEEGRAIGAAIAQALQQPESAAILPLAQDEVAEPGVTISATADFDPASDPLLPEMPAALPRSKRGPISLRAIAEDDRDLIVVDDETPPPAIPLSGGPRRAEYRQLFSKLRSQS